MSDVANNLAMDDVIAKLDSHNVPGTGLSWERILLFAKSYEEPIVYAEPVEPKSIKLSSDQEAAWDKLTTWVNTDQKYFLLRGYAGAGKTHMLRMLNTIPGLDVIYTAPTNKAAKVISNAVGRKAVTTFSAFGIQMKQEDDHLVLTFSDTPPYIPPKAVVVVDECSMVGRELYNFVDQTDSKILYVGDPAQLPPVGEERSRTWKCTSQNYNRAFLKQIMRYDNDLLTLATELRDAVQYSDKAVRITNRNDGNVGVFVDRLFRNKIARLNNPKLWANNKLVAWRNKTVNEYNDIIRDSFGFTQPYHSGDILLLAEPIQEDGNIIASIDDEFTVTGVTEAVRKVNHNTRLIDIPVWRLEVTGDIETTLYIPKPDSRLDTLLSAKADIARNAAKVDRKEAWRDFWSTKAMFHKVRYGYAMTAHRAQGSTYENVFIDQKDILLNQNTREALRCLYVAATRASTNIHSY